MGKNLSKEQVIHNEGAKVEIQNNIQGNSNTVNINYTATKEPELEDYNFPEPIDSFKGRENELKQLNDCLFSDDKKMAVIWGLPGFGKSELLKQFARKCKLANKIKYICWIEASKIDTLEHSLKNLAEILNLPKVDGRALMQKVSNRHQDSKTLFVFDDVENARTLLDWKTPRGCWTLVTSQFGEWDSLPSIELGPLEREAAVAVLQHQQDPVVTSDLRPLRTLAALLDDAPLALQLAAAYIRQETKLFPKKFNILKYIQKLRKSREKFVNEPVPAHTFLPYQYSIQVAMKLSLEKIRDLNKFESKFALDILNILAYLNPYQILEESLLKFSFIQNKLKQEENEDEEREPEMDVRRALYVLESYAFVHLEDGFVKIHGLVQETVLFYHNKTEGNIDAYYTSCLEYVLHDPTESHYTSVLKQADKKLEIFKKFFDKYKPNIISDEEIKLLNRKLYANVIQKTILDDKTEDLYKQMCLFHQKSVHQTYSDNDADDDKLMDEVHKFFKTNYNTNFRITYLEMLVIAGSEKCLAFIFSDLGSQAKEVIAKHRLLCEAMYSYQPNTIKLLVKYGEDINSNSIAGNICTILHRAVTCLNIDFINLILDQNADINSRDVLGDTPICYAILSPFMMQLDTGDIICRVMHTLVTRGAAVYNVTNQGCSLLHVAVRWIRTAMHLKVVEFIVDELKVKVDTLNTEDGTALHIIIGRRVNQVVDDELTGKVVDVLLKRDASVDIKNVEGVTPLDIIKEHKFDFLLPILKCNGAQTKN